jgi:F-type H+-transporting ATPase subunit a
MSAAQSLVTAAEIHIGEHKTFTFLGMTFNGDTILSTLVAGFIVLGMGLLVARSASATNPGKLQLLWEALVNWVTVQVESNLGRVNPFVIPLAIALFAFILIANWLELVPSDHQLPAPTADVNLTYALGILVIIGVHIYSVRERGVKGYVQHYFQPYKALFPILVIEEIVKPFTLALRLFGNIFSGGIMLSIIGLMPVWILWGANGAWKLFDFFIGVIQAFIFALLTILYFGMAGSSAHGDEAHETKTEEEQAPAGSTEPGTTAAQPEWAH